MKKITLFLVVALWSSTLNAQESKPTSQSHPGKSFENFLAGLRTAEILTTPEQEQLFWSNPGSNAVYWGVVQYLKAMGFEYVGFSSNINSINMASLCDNTGVLVRYDVNGAYINNLTVTFFSPCTEEWWEFKASSVIIMNSFGTVEDKVYNKVRKMYGNQKPKFNRIHRRKLKSEGTQWTESRLKEQFKKGGADPIEGIYERTSETEGMARYKVGVIKEKGEYIMVYLGGAKNYEDWIEGELKAKMIRTATPSLFKLEWKMGDKTVNDQPYATFEAGLMNVFWQDRDKGMYIKLYPTQNDNINVVSNVQSSGTGFALSSDGSIVTNYHVTEGASKIKVRGVKGDFSKVYSAKILIEDKNNDLAVLKIDDPNFTSLGALPYEVDYKISDVGNAVYALGYPLRATMGDEVKLTNGIVSSKTGFQGDITTYQISVPVQPGNSGGPLFDSKGNIVGVINAKHTGAENASYAIKASYLMNLIHVMDAPPSLPTLNRISSMSLSEQVKFVKEFVYIIEVN